MRDLNPSTIIHRGEKMKKLIFAFMASLFTTSFAFANTTWTCTQPPSCIQIVSSEYSTAGGDSTFQMLEIGCRTKNGGYVIYTDAVATAAGFFGMGRIGSVDKIVFVPGKKDKMDCK